MRILFYLLLIGLMVTSILPFYDDSGIVYACHDGDDNGPSHGDPGGLGPGPGDEEGGSGSGDMSTPDNTDGGEWPRVDQE